MKYHLSLLLIVVFLGLNIFGFLAFNHKMDDGDNSCFASAIDGNSCPMNILNFVLHHFLALQMFTKGLVATGLNFLASLALIYLLLSFWISRRRSYLAGLKLQFSPPRERDLLTNPHLSQLKFIRWLALLEQNPSL